MKRLHRLFLCVALLLHGALYAQEPRLSVAPTKEQKPLLFSSLPDSFEVDQSALQKIFAAEKNDALKLQLSSQFFVDGIVVDKNQHTPGSMTVNIRLYNYSNALFNITLRLLADNSTNIQGRILHPKYGDILQLYKNRETYLIKKSSRALYMPE